MPKANFFPIILTLSLLLMMGQSFLFAFPSIETRSFQSFGPGQDGIRGDKGYQAITKILGDLALASRPRYGKRSITFPRSWYRASSPEYYSANGYEDTLSQRLAAELENLFPAAAAASSRLSPASLSSSSLQLGADNPLDKRSTEKV